MQNPPPSQPAPLPAPLQVFVPVYSVSMAQHLALQLWDFSASLHKSEFERVADLALACMLLDQVDGRGEPSSA